MAFYQLIFLSVTVTVEVMSAPQKPADAEPCRLYCHQFFIMEPGISWEASRDRIVTTHMTATPNRVFYDKKTKLCDMNIRWPSPPEGTCRKWVGMKTIVCGDNYPRFKNWISNDWHGTKLETKHVCETVSVSLNYYCMT